MAGETLKTEAICLDIRPWSRTSHVVSWLTPNGRLLTVVKGAVRPKSSFLGQYDLNYTCEILYYARAKGELHALRDCVPLELRESLRSNYKALALAGYFRQLVSELAPSGPDCRSWFSLLSSSLSTLNSQPSTLIPHPSSLIPHPSSLIPHPSSLIPHPSSLIPHPSSLISHPSSLISFELEILRLSGLSPDFSGVDRTAEWSAFSVETGTFGRTEGRCIRVSREVADYLCHPLKPVKNPQIPLDAARVIGVFYQFHLDCAFETRRTVLGMIS